ncbi:MAG TPA: hypothetical protein VEU96_19475 [Bryobacteraceae bacterium]|nr:hypothetical protein [Bryobacteraceae bacterium]
MSIGKLFATGLFAVIAATAAPITYTFSINTFGTLGSTPFNGLVTFTITTDTTLIMNSGGSQINSSIPPANVVITTPAGTVTLTGGTILAKTASSISFVAFPSTLGVVNSSLSSYDLATATGPVTGTLAIGAPVIQTSVGNLTLSGGGFLTFAAALGIVPPPPPAPVPLPPSVVLTLIGLAALSLYVWSGRKSLAG